MASERAGQPGATPSFPQPQVVEGLQALIELKGSPIEGTRWIAAEAVDYAGPTATQTGVAVRLRSGLALQGSHKSVQSLASELRASLGTRLVALGEGFLNLDALDAILPNGKLTVLRLRGGSNVVIDSGAIAALDAALTRSSSLPAKVAA